MCLATASVSVRECPEPELLSSVEVGERGEGGARAGAGGGEGSLGTDTAGGGGGGVLGLAGGGDGRMVSSSLATDMML